MKNASKKKIVLVFAAAMLLAVLLGTLMVWVWYVLRTNQRDTPEPEPISMQELVESFLHLPRSEQTRIFTNVIWGEERVEHILMTGVPQSTPWGNVTVQGSFFANRREIEAFTYTVFEFAPEVTMGREDYFIIVGDNLILNVMEIQHTFSEIQFQYPYAWMGNMDVIEVFGVYNGQLFREQFTIPIS
jgi:hypothetical protein